ncbi:putative 26S proteasome regulatory complex, subunit RPN3 [Monocercomonoides exilis]|uniref:putative 26S proteasome regulatory complex, subunit RPN3 n=1 Tax=Monocercomonoides exilis TaxID=2049356 RepID=UPI00355A8C2D|nr:putative 26S proteasome regulatory complex, subunit RPN3 [Monocercomonoides exilis]|eukprot:MONOS_204.1-p1 / transcript=MONOS_204.1 / gene=MONOS_204 / organism=Monocercomonoides_exilis_PA203 / gene_product=26S proteasome regulatory complex, subunit RPN3 / transcript_product=26S proteasome regulatory complex, subunit RPN3 / location=Mono_scaffold00003:248478-250627(-) / protein_length=552 / sequence_SO=supercontig / SO=protein_coding / is_pseudo=false
MHLVMGRSNMSDIKVTSIELIPLPRLIRRCTAFKNGVSSEKLGWYISTLKLSEQSKSFLLPLLNFNPENPKNAEFAKEEEIPPKISDRALMVTPSATPVPTPDVSANSSPAEAKDAMDVEEAKEEKKDEKKDDKTTEDKKENDEKDKKKKTPIVVPPIKYTHGMELEGFLRLLAVMVLYREKNYDRALTCAQDLVMRLGSLQVEQRQPLFDVLAKTYYFISRILVKKGGKDHLYASRVQFTTALRTAIHVNDAQGQATLINIILSIFINQGEFVQANQFLSSVVFPPVGSCASVQHARYAFYVATLRAIEGKHKEADENIQLALSRSPKHVLGFRIACTKLSVLVQLLQGFTPKRSIFFEPGFSHELKPYLDITSAVREGRVKEFDEIVASKAEIFKKDGLYSLIIRLRLNVVQTGLRRLCRVYSTLSLEDIKQKLVLSSESEAESAASKAISDGLIDAVIDHDAKCIRTMEEATIYETTIPNDKIQRRITACVDINERLMKAMRYSRLRNWDEEDEELRKAREEIENEFGQLENANADEDPGFGGPDDEPM